MRAAIGALGGDAGRLRGADHAARPRRRGRRRARCRSARGEFVTLDELVDDIGVDATRFFMLQRSHDTTFDLDLDAGPAGVEREPRLLRPVRARAHRQHPAQGGPRRPSESARGGPGPARRRRGRAGRAGADKRLLELPAEVAEAAERRAPHRLCAYAQAIAADFHAFYRDCQVLGLDDPDVEESRLGLSLVSKRAIAQTLGLLGISAPERM